MSTIEAISPFPIDELPRVWLWLQEAGSSLLNDQGPQTMDEFVDGWLDREGQVITWGVYRDGELGGWGAYEPISALTGNIHCVFSKRFWGGDVTRPAIEQAVNSLFGIGVERIGMTVMAHNNAIRSVIGWLGGEKEADIYKVYLPDGQLLTRKGKPIGLVQYGLYKANWDARRTTAVVDAGDLLVGDNSMVAGA